MLGGYVDERNYRNTLPAEFKRILFDASCRMRRMITTKKKKEKETVEGSDRTANAS